MAEQIGGLVEIVRKHTVVGEYPNTYAIASEAFELGRQAGEKVMEAENVRLALLAANGAPVLQQLDTEEQDALVDFIRSLRTPATLNRSENDAG